MLHKIKGRIFDWTGTVYRIHHWVLIANYSCSNIEKALFLVKVWFFLKLYVYIIKRGEKREMVVVKAFGVIYRVCFVCDLRKSVRCIVLSKKKEKGASLRFTWIHQQVQPWLHLTFQFLYIKIPCQYCNHSRVNDSNHSLSHNLPSCKSEVHKVRLSLSNCMIRVESL